MTEESSTIRARTLFMKRHSSFPARKRRYFLQVCFLVYRQGVGKLQPCASTAGGGGGGEVIVPPPQPAEKASKATRAERQLAFINSAINWHSRDRPACGHALAAPPGRHFIGALNRRQWAPPSSR